MVERGYTAAPGASPGRMVHAGEEIELIGRRRGGCRSFSASRPVGGACDRMPGFSAYAPGQCERLGNSMQIVDRRLNPKSKSLGNRQRFLRRAKAEIREAIKDLLEDRAKVSEAEGAEKVTIRSKSLREPSLLPRPLDRCRATMFCRATRSTGSGDEIPKPQGGGGGRGNQGSPDGEGQDEFTFTLTKEEFLDLFFDDLKLPNLIKVRLKDLKAPKSARAGFTTDGPPARLSRTRTMRKSLVGAWRCIDRARPKSKRLEAELAGGGRRGAARVRRRSRRCALKVEHKQRLRRTIAYIDPHRSAVQPVRTRAKADDPGGDVLPDGCLRVDDRAAQGLGQALLHALARVPLALLPRGAPGLHTPHQHGRRGRRGDVLPRHRDRRYGHLHGTRRDAESRDAIATRQRTGTSMRRRPPMATISTTICRADAASLSSKEVLPICQYFAYIETTHGERFNDPSETPVWHGYAEIVRARKNFAMRRVAAPERHLPRVPRAVFGQRPGSA